MRGHIDDQFGKGNINVHTNCPIFRSLAKNDLYYSEFVNRGLVRTAAKGDYEAISWEIYHRLLHFIQLEDSLQKKFDNITKSFKDRFVVGMQIRVGLGNGAFVDNCKFLFMSDIQTFVHYANYYTNQTTRKPLWFVSTDSAEVERILYDQYSDRVLFLSELPMKHTKSLAYKKFEPAVQRAILDNYLLSQSDLLITTAWSSFGEMALGRMERGSHIMITRSDPILHPPPTHTFDRLRIA